MLSEDESSDSETVRNTLHYSGQEYSGPQTPDPRMLNPPAEIPSNIPTDTLIHDIDSPMRPPSNVEVPPMTTSVASQPNTDNQPASAALQRLHNYIDSQLINLVGVAVEQEVGTRCNQLADTIQKEIASIRDRVFRDPRDEDDPMQPKDQHNDNSADGDDESEENNKNHRPDRQNWRKNNRKRQQTADDDNEDEDENDSGANNGRRRKAPIVLTVHNYLPQFSHETTNANIVCPPCISATEGADGKGGVGPPKWAPASMCTCPRSPAL